MPNIDSENVRKTLMLYMTTSWPTSPFVYRSAISDVAPIKVIPLWVVRRSDSAAKRRGTHESTAMFASTRGPSMKPAWAATTSNTPSEIMVTTTSTRPSGRCAVSRSARSAFIVLPATGVTCHSR